MSRSVSTHPDSVQTVFINHQVTEDYEWEDFLDDVRNVIQAKYPSFTEFDGWKGNENHVVLQNHHAEVSVSEYNGIVAICLIPRTDATEALEVAWCNKIAGNFRKLLHEAYKGSAMQSMGYGSNGEGFFSLVEQPGSVVTSKEGRLW